MGSFYPASSIQVPRAKSPMESLGQMMQLKNLKLQQKSAELDLVQAQRQDQQRRKLENDMMLIDQVMEGAGGDIRSRIDKIKEINPDIGLGYEKQIRELDKLDLENKERTLDLLEQRTDRMASLAEGMFDEGSKNLAVQQGFTEGLIDEQQVQRLLATPYSEAMKDRIRKKSMLSKEVFAYEQKKVKMEREAPETRIALALKEHDLVGQTMGGASSQASWTARMEYLKKKGTDPTLLNLLGDTYSQESVEQARELMEFAKEEKGKEPSAAGKALALRGLQQAKTRAESSFRKTMQSLQTDWQFDEGSQQYMNFKASTTASAPEYQGMLDEAKENRDSDIDRAENNYLAQLEAYGHEPELPERPEPKEGSTAKMVKMEAPDGSTAMVPEDQVQAAKAAGATVVQE